MIILKKSGIFYKNAMDPDHDDYVYKQVESIIPHLGEEIEIEDGFTLRDFFEVIEEDAEILEVVFSFHLGGNPLAPYLTEVQQDCMPDNREDMECIKCSWVAEQFDYTIFYEEHKDDESACAFLPGGLHEPDGDEVNEISIYPDIHGWGKFDDDKSGHVIPKDEQPSHTSYGIEFTPLHKMAHLPIKLDTDFEMCGKNDVGCDNPIVKGKRNFTVFEFFGDMLSEISFCGLPEERNEKWQDIVDSFNEMKEEYEDKEDEEEE